jgi:hypothetical protein
MIAMDWDPQNDSWLAGFTDGEGCFVFQKYPNDGRIQPRFVIGLRADDTMILERLHGTFGGRLQFKPVYDSSRGSSPQCVWYVLAKRDLARLVEYFDRFPLRAKKARDYAIWRQAVSVYCAAGGTDHRLRALREALMAGRVFDGPNIDKPDPDDPFEVQLALGIED